MGIKLINNRHLVRCFLYGRAGYIPGFYRGDFMEQNQDLDDRLDAQATYNDYLMIESEVSAVVCLGED